MADGEYSRFSFESFINRTNRNYIFNMSCESFTDDRLVILLHPDSIYFPLSSIYPLKTRIKHNCSQVYNECPTIEQYYQQFKVSRRDLIMDKKKKVIGK